MRKLLSFAGQVSPLVYVLAAPVLLLSQNLMVALCYRWRGAPLQADAGFWLLPLRRLAQMPGVTAMEAATVFAVGVVVAWALAALSFRRANWSGRGHRLSLFAIFPVIQIIVVTILCAMPRQSEGSEEQHGDAVDRAQILQGVLTGVAIIVVAVLISALTLGAYGWGLFVATPFAVGMATGYIVNRRVPQTGARTLGHVLVAGALGGLALLMFALEGFMCIVLVAPLGLATAAIGGVFGRAIALFGHDGNRPLMSVAVLPALFALEASMPPAVPIDTVESIDIAASPAAVWRAITSEAPIGLSPGLPGLAGLAYPVRSSLKGQGVGATRLGVFSTGTAVERVTEWKPGRVLAFTVLSQPPAMEEMSPYRHLNTPHLRGYVVTGDTRYLLSPLRSGDTRLTLQSQTVLRIDPIAYWEPIARLAFHLNVRRVLNSAKMQAEGERFE
ncbi:SRPBCC family protein [Novosphingobium sp. 1949]|uniref:SRPBCC family protein n=1 Tax=Novosphingobium organovorum TaxID=2930092 RepID=A0ABT0BE65_9SPHN|nr:SRPBCC family protein [Novosphingobium organovorum]MCJ2183332.1 SRPBCC family protein [Novosphingobium organovorum]